MNRQFMKIEIRVMEKCPVSLVIKDMQSKIMCVFSPDKLAKIGKRRMLIPNVYCYSFQGCGEIRAVTSCCWEGKPV
jgi:hypothetical protein